MPLRARRYVRLLEKLGFSVEQMTLIVDKALETRAIVVCSSA